jgi:hypothetical protein
MADHGSPANEAEEATMFLGHYGVAFALKRAQPKLSLGTLFVAVQLADLLWGAFLLAGWERVRIDPGYTAVTPLQFLEYPISHGLVGMALWAAVGAAVYYSWPTRDTSRHWQAAVLVGLAILSHFALDLPVHVADLPLGGQDSHKVGFGLWNNPTATLLLELATLAAGVAVYVVFRSRRHFRRPQCDCVGDRIARPRRLVRRQPGPPGARRAGPRCRRSRRHRGAPGRAAETADATGDRCSANGSTARVSRSP